MRRWAGAQRGFAFAFSRVFFLGLACGALAAFGDVAPRDYYGKIGRRVAGMLPKHHVLQMPMNDEISRRAWTNLVTYYDYDHSVFLKSDLDRLAARETTLDDELASGDVSFGYDVYNLYVQRLNERMLFATNLIVRDEWDFTSNETYRIKRKDAPWPASVAEAEDSWRRRIKNEVLVQVANAELDKATNKVDAAGSLVKKYRQYMTVLTDPDEEAVLQHYFSAVARAYDPHSDYMSPASKEDFDMEMNLTLCGVGAVLSMDEGALKIVEIMPGGPVDRDGRIKEGDKIIGVQQGDGVLEDVMWQPMQKTIKKIRGKKGTRVTLQIIPRSDPSGVTKKLIELVRDEIKLEDQAATGRVERVVFNGVTNKLGYVYLPGFYGTMDKRYGEKGFRSCALDVSRYLADFNSQDVAGMILDLRGNGGGSLREAILLSSLFVPAGPVVQVRDTRAVGCLPIPPGSTVAFRKPMLVLTDRASASASEIVAGHLQDTGRAIVMGDNRTHGKGTVQTVMGMGPEKYGSMKITTQRFYRINGRSTQVEGVAADIHAPSLLDSLDIGEDKLTYALPFTRILPADYDLCWNMRDYVKDLRAGFEARTKDNARYKKHLENVAGMKEVSEREEVSLEKEARKKQMAADREYRELDEAEDDLAEACDGTPVDAVSSPRSVDAESLPRPVDAVSSPRQNKDGSSSSDAERLRVYGGAERLRVYGDAERLRVCGDAASSPRQKKDTSKPSDKSSDKSSDKPSDKPPARRRRNERPKDDVVLDLAFDVLSDLVGRTGGAELELPKGWWQ